MIVAEARSASTTIATFRSTSSTLTGRWATSTINRGLLASGGLGDPQAGVDGGEAGLGLRPDVAVDVAAAGIHGDGQGTERVDAELPEALRHQLFKVDGFDGFDLERLDPSGTADDRQVDPTVALEQL